MSFEMFCTKIVLCLVLRVTISTAEDNNINYEGAQVWRTVLKNSDDVETVSDLHKDLDISIWELTTKRADFLVKNEDKLKVHRILSAQQINHTVLILDVKRRVDAIQSQPAAWNEISLRVGHRLNWSEYPTSTIINEYLNYISDYYGSICTVETIGRTHENRPIQMVKISNGNPNNKVILVSAGSHAREWTAITSALYLIDYLVTNYDELPENMKSKDWLIIPVLNPDGFEYSHTTDRLWRKNRRPSARCVGVDINRNYDSSWDVSGLTVKNQCAEGFGGKEPFSEAESTALRDVILSLKKRLQVYLDLHTYGHKIMYPWGTKSRPTDHRKIHNITAVDLVTKLHKKTGREYKHGATYDLVYPATGTSIDWAYSMGVPFPLAIEVDSEDHGFLTPPEYITESGKDVLTIVKGLTESSQQYIYRTKEEDYWF